MKTLRAWVGRDNRQRLSLFIDGTPVAADAVTRAQFQFGKYCIDTDVAADPIELVDNATVVEMQLGKVAGLASAERIYAGRLTIYDNTHAAGIAWDNVQVQVSPWPVC